jgi:hypothetical protein
MGLLLQQCGEVPAQHAQQEENPSWTGGSDRVDEKGKMTHRTQRGEK